jgi:transglutaminase superfamily protein
MLLTIRHLTVYRYAEPVGLGEHRMMFRPRESHDLRLLDARLDIPHSIAFSGNVLGLSQSA